MTILGIRRRCMPTLQIVAIRERSEWGSVILVGGIAYEGSTLAGARGWACEGGRRVEGRQGATGSSWSSSIVGGLTTNGTNGTIETIEMTEERARWAVRTAGVKSLSTKQSSWVIDLLYALVMS